MPRCACRYSGSLHPPAKSKPTAAPGDPFDKHQGAKPPDEPPANILATVEIYAMAQDDAAKLLADNPGGEARYAAALELAGHGKARFETLISFTGRSGQRSQVLQTQEVSYPMRMDFNTQTNQWACNFQTEPVGESLELEVVMSPDKSTCDFSLDLSSERFDGFRENGAQYVFAAQPLFESRKLTTSLTALTGKMAFLGTLNAPPESIDSGAQGKNPNETRLVFGRISFVPIAAGNPLAGNVGDILEHQIVFYSMDREAARQVLAGDPKPGAFYDAVLALAGKQQARLERTTILKTKSARRAVVQEIEKAPYPRDFMQNMPVIPANLFNLPTYFQPATLASCWKSSRWRKNPWSISISIPNSRATSAT